MGEYKAGLTNVINVLGKWATGVDNIDLCENCPCGKYLTRGTSINY